ncbi:MAG: hypothetical protein D6734_02190 [Candidatus Schekmanbacteria bacterium]|nr:MAG: hypothetical protein D6734_02190 [Candidatus Schekmanbacteria bacterium]
MTEKEKMQNILKNIIQISILIYVVVLPFNHRATLSALCLIIAAFCWILSMIIERKFILKKTALNVPLGLVFLIALISAIFSIDSACSLNFFRSEILKAVFIFFAIVNFFDSERRIKQLVWLLMFSFVLMNIYGLAEYFAILRPAGRKLDATLGHHNKVGMFADLVFPLILIYALKVKDWKSRIPLLFFGIISLTAVIFTQSRGAWVSIILGLLICGIFYDRKILNALAVILIILPLILPANIMKRVTTIFDFDDYLKPGRVLVERPFVWKGAVKIIKKYPIIGAGTGSDIFYKLYVEKGFKPKRAKQKLGHAHNQILETLVENGIAGLIAQIIFFVSFFKTINTGIKKSDDSIKKVILLGCFTGVAAILFHGIIGSFWRSRMIFLLMILMGIGTSCAVYSDLKDSDVIEIVDSQWEKEKEKKLAAQI